MSVGLSAMHYAKKPASTAGTVCVTMVDLMRVLRSATWGPIVWIVVFAMARHPSPWRGVRTVLTVPLESGVVSPTNVRQRPMPVIGPPRHRS